MANRPVITARQWREHKPHILSLYVDKNWPLRLVRQELATKGFEPTESQYRSRFKKWKVHKHSMLKTAEKTTSDGPVQMSDIMAAQEACPPLRPLTIERTNPLHHTPLNNQEAAHPYLTGAAGRIGNNDDNYDWDSAGLGEAESFPTTNNRSTIHAELHPHHDERSLYRMQIDGLAQGNLYAQDHVGPLPDGDQNSFEMGWDELEAYPYHHRELEAYPFQHGEQEG